MALAKRIAALGTRMGKDTHISIVQTVAMATNNRKDNLFFFAIFQAKETFV